MRAEDQNIVAAPVVEIAILAEAQPFLHVASVIVEKFSDIGARGIYRFHDSAVAEAGCILDREPIAWADLFVNVVIRAEQNPSVRWGWGDFALKLLHLADGLPIGRTRNNLKT